MAEINNGKEKYNIEELLRAGTPVQFKPQGYSMYPVIVSGRDWVEVEPFDGANLKRGDVAVYRREGSVMIIHRVWHHKKDGLYMVGDNQKEIEGPLPESAFFGKMTYLQRKGKRISVRNFWYRFLTGGWLLLRPFRPTISKLVHKLKRT